MDEHKYALRVPRVLWDEIVVAAGRARRSINSEIVWRLSQAAEGGLSERELPPVGAEGSHPRRLAGSGSRSESSFRPDFKGGKR